MEITNAGIRQIMGLSSKCENLFRQYKYNLMFTMDGYSVCSQQFGIDSTVRDINIFKSPEPKALEEIRDTTRLLVRKKIDELAKECLEDIDGLSSLIYQGTSMSLNGYSRAHLQALASFRVEYASGNCGMLMFRDLVLERSLDKDLLPMIMLKIAHDEGRSMILMTDYSGGIIDQTVTNMPKEYCGAPISVDRSETVLNNNSGNEIVAISVLIDRSDEYESDEDEYGEDDDY